MGSPNPVPTWHRGVRGFVARGRFYPSMAGGDPIADPPKRGDTGLREKLQQVEDDLTQLRTDRADKLRKADELKKTWADEPGYDTESDSYKAAIAARAEVDEVGTAIEKARDAQLGILRMIGQAPGDEGNGSNGYSKALVPQHGGGGWDGRRITEGEAYKALAQHPAVFSEKARVGTHVLGEVASRDALKAAIASTDVGQLIPPEMRGLAVQLPFQPLRLLDLLPSAATSSSTIDYVQEVATAIAIAPVAEGAAKPEDSFDFQDASAVVRTIAGWVKINKQTLADAPVLQGFIDNRLRYRTRRVLEGQVASGDGTGQNLRGLLNTTGIQVAPVGAGESPIDRLHHGIVSIWLANYEPSFIGLSPRDWEGVRLAREATAGEGTATGGYLMGAPAILGGQVLFGFPVVVSPAFPDGTGIVGDAQAALVLLREGVNVLVSDSDQDDFIHNRVTMLAETRAGLVVWAPQAFATVDLAAA
jgi:HK97 family phage major capsid protein